MGYKRTRNVATCSVVQIYFLEARPCLVRERRREEDGHESSAGQQSGQGHDQPQLSISLFELRELLANLRQNTFSLCMHPVIDSKKVPPDSQFCFF
jgi:hypothetical protein